MIEGVSASRLERLEGYNNIVKWVMTGLENCGYGDEDLDEFVHDIADHLAAQEANRGSGDDADQIVSDWSAQASDINNSGMEAQIRVILGFHGVREGITFLNEQLREGGFFCDFPETLLRISERSAAR